MSKNTQSTLLAKFQSRFRSSANVYRAPGRVNLIGEHTDYNDGFVLPAGIEFSCRTAIARRNDRKLVLYSENFDESVEADLDNLTLRRTGNWSDYSLGVAWALERAGLKLKGADLYIVGEVPLGAGLSSSAAVEVSVGYALMDMANYAFEPTKLALLCQQAENEFVGARCGIMDQFVSCHGRAGAATAFQTDDVEALKGLMSASHQSLRDDFEVSCRELDIMVEIAMRQPGVLGARMTGGGFGGCTINLVDAAHADEFCKRVAEGYETATGLHPDIYISEASQGAEKMF